VAQKRSDFEHKLNARGSLPIDWARYAEYEMNLDTLRRARAKRMGAKMTQHTGQRRILFILERATRKFHGDLGLWAQYFEYAKKQKAYKRVSQLLTKAVRLHPTKPEVWVQAARYAMDEQGDIMEARGYMQRGLRFCKNSEEMWLEYHRLELQYLAKISARSQILGLEAKPARLAEGDAIEDDTNDCIALSNITAGDFIAESEESSKAASEATEVLHRRPALSGAIPNAIFDAAMGHFKDVDLGSRFLDLTLNYHMSCQKSIIEHVVGGLMASDPSSDVARDAFVKEPMLGREASSPEFPDALKISLDRLKSFGSDQNTLSSGLIVRTISWLSEYLKLEDLDQDIRTVLAAVLSRTVSQYRNLDSTVHAKEEAVAVIKSLEAANLKEGAEDFRVWASTTWPSSKELLTSPMAVWRNKS